MNTLQQTNHRNNSNKETLAKLMAREGVTVVYDSSQHTASFNTKTRVLILPVMMGSAEYVYDWFIAHEVSHALYTPSDDNFYSKITDKVLAGYFNVTEDARIEKLIKLKYPGTKKDCRQFYEHFSDPSVDFFKIKDKDISTMKLIDRINLHFKIGHIVPISFTEEEQEYVDMVDSSMTAEDALETAKKLLDRERQQQQQSSDQDGQGNGKKPKTKVKIKMPGKAPSSQGDSGDSDDEEDSDVEVQVEYEEPSDDQQSGGGDRQEDSDDSDSSQQGGGDDSDDEEDSDTTTIEIDLTAPETQEAFAEAMQKMFGSNPSIDVINPENSTKSVNNIIKDMEKHTQILKGGYKNFSRFDQYKKLMSSGKPVINTLVSYFNMKKKASEYQKIQESKSGKLDMKKISQYLLTDDLFLRNDIVKEAKNHGLFFLLDYSGSMSGRIKDTFKQLILLVEFCRSSGIPYEVYGFTNGSTRVAPDSVQVKSLLATTEGTALVKILDYTMKKNDHMQACEYILMGNDAISMSGTPICGAMMASEQLIRNFQAKTNVEKTVFCILTDGGTSDTCTSAGSTKNSKMMINSSRKRYSFDSKEDAWKVLAACMKDSLHLHSTVGFYLCDDTDVRTNGIQYSFLNNNPKINEYASEMKRNGSFETADVMGFDKYFFVTTDKIKQFINNASKDALKATSEQAADQELSRAFTNNLQGKSLKNLSFLKIFIEQIS